MLRIFSYHTSSFGEEGSRRMGAKIDTVVWIDVNIRSFSRESSRVFAWLCRIVKAWCDHNCSVRAGPLSVLLVIHAVIHSKLRFASHPRAVPSHLFYSHVSHACITSPSVPPYPHARRTLQFLRCQCLLRCRSSLIYLASWPRPSVLYFTSRFDFLFVTPPLPFVSRFTLSRDPCLSIAQ